MYLTVVTESLLLNHPEKGLSVIIPCYQSESSLNRVVSGICDALNKIIGLDYEIILVLDGPTDNTSKIAYKLQDDITECGVVELTRNFGQHPAIFAGISSAKHEVIITMDDDGQHLPSEIPVLIEALTFDTDLVYGVPTKDEHGLIRSFGSRFFKTALFRILGIKNARDISAFRIFRKSLLAYIDFSKISVGTVDVALHWNTTRIKSSKVTMSRRLSGKSNYSFRSLARFAIQMIIGYSAKPLKFALFLGLLGFLLSAGLAIYFFVQYLDGNVNVAGFTTTTILITVLSSIQLMTLGILGEYIASIHQRSMSKPTFNIREKSIG